MYALFACCLAWLGLSPAVADSISDFYGGRAVTLIVSTSSAGGYDTLARAIARHIGKHIAGNPTVIVRNMPGAGGLTATNYLYAVAERDGSVIGLVQNKALQQQLKENIGRLAVRDAAGLIANEILAAIGPNAGNAPGPRIHPNPKRQ